MPNGARWRPVGGAYFKFLHKTSANGELARGGERFLEYVKHRNREPGLSESG